LSISAEFACSRGILRNLVLAREKVTNTACFGWVQAAVKKLITTREIRDWYSSSNGTNIENSELQGAIENYLLFVENLPQ